MKHLKVSIVVPMYNAGKTIERCIESINQQDYNKIQLIVVDDGSTDDSYLICKNVLSASRFESIIIKKTNGGVSSARNEGIKKANGDLIVFIDSDDSVCQKFISIMVNQYVKSDVDLAICGYKTIFNVDNSIKYIPSFSYLGSKEDYEKNITEMIDARYILSPWAKIYNLSIIKANNIFFDESRSIGEDLLFNLEYLSYGMKIGVSNYIGYNYYIQKNESLIHTFTSERIKNTASLFNLSIALCDGIGIDNCKFAFSKYYYKSHLNFIENMMYRTNKKENTKFYIKQILEQNEIYLASNYYRKGDKELTIYRYIFSNKSLFGIYLICKIRIMIKKYIRGY